MTSTEMFPAKGTYTLIVFLRKEAQLKVRKLGTQRFSAGYYTYTGSALGTGASSLKQRVMRHLQKRKRKFWHIDFLLAHENAAVSAVIAAQTDGKAECNMNLSLKKKLEAKILVAGFGASDCKQNCESHLLFFPEITKEDILVNKVVKCYRTLDDIHVLRVR
ncbi:MAG: GIY-YIG nuclease family protein [Candidatus Bathyarchaeota archaeon]|nr:MAG: GIY-YIG nuclease family protein [Candidatus Bathyarchaeota archaeon]